MTKKTIHTTTMVLVANEQPSNNSLTISTDAFNLSFKALGLENDQNKPPSVDGINKTISQFLALQACSPASAQKLVEDNLKRSVDIHEMQQITTTSTIVLLFAKQGTQIQATHIVVQ